MISLFYKQGHENKPSYDKHSWANKKYYGHFVDMLCPKHVVILFIMYNKMLQQIPCDIHVG